MSEVMALESLAEEWLRFEGFWTQTRVPFRLHGALEPSGPSSDIDVIGVKLNGGRHKVVVVEVKGHGSPDAYPDYKTVARLHQVKKLCLEKKRNIRVFKDSHLARQQLGITRVDELRLILPGRLVPLGKGRARLQRQLEQECELPFDLRIFSIDEMIGKLAQWVKDDKDVRRKRYANTALEMIRWILRSKEDPFTRLFD